MSTKYQARDLLKLSPDELWALKDECGIVVVFDDGELVTDTRKTIFSVYLWEFHRLYPNTPLLKKHHIQDQRLSSKTHLELLGQGLWDAYDTYNQELNIDEMCRIAYETTNRLYNDMTYRLEAYVTSIDILDFIDVMDHPKVFEANSTVRPAEASITHTHNAIEEVLMTPGELKGNPIAENAKSRLVDMGQILQCVGPRGTPTDIDSTIFRQPILTGFTDGMRSLLDSMMESRSAAMALMFAQDPVAESEYFNRKMQLLTATIKRLYGVAEIADELCQPILKEYNRRDCGSQVYREFKMNAGDLGRMLGKYYLTEDGSLAPIREGDRHLIGQKLKIRSVLDCHSGDREGICATCFGELALSVPGRTNIGHLCATTLCEIISQAVLSTKHLVRSASVDELPLSDFERRFIRVGSDINYIMLSPNLKGKVVKMTLSGEEARNLSDIFYTEDVTNLPVGRVTELKQIGMTVGSGDKVEEVTLPVSVGSRTSSLTHQALEYIKTHDWKLTPEGNYEIDLTEWNRDEPLLQVALRHVNMVDFMKSIEFMVRASKSRGKVKRTLKDYEDLWSALMALYDLISSKLSVNLAHIEVIVKATLIRSARDLDYNLPLPGEEWDFGKYQDNISLRSLSAQFAYQEQVKAIYDVRSYNITDRPSHPLDVMLSGG